MAKSLSDEAIQLAKANGAEPGRNLQLEDGTIVQIKAGGESEEGSLAVAAMKFAKTDLGSIQFPDADTSAWFPPASGDAAAEGEGKQQQVAPQPGLQPLHEP